MAIVKLNPLSDKRWLEFIHRSSQATVFHHPSWLKVLNSQYRFPVFAICVKDENDKIRAGMPFCEVRSILGRKRWISLPFTDHCEILFQDISDVKEILKHLISSYDISGVDQIEIRSRIPGQHKFIENSAVLAHILELSGNPKNNFEKFKSSHMRGIKKALRNDLKAEIMNSECALDEFYRLHLQTRKRLGIPIQPKSYFHCLYEHVIDRGFGFILLVLKTDRVIAASIFLTCSDTLVYKYGASDPRFLGLRPNNLKFWKAIEEGCLRGFKCLDLGKTDIGQTGLRRFKSGWGAEESPLYYSYYPDVPKERVYVAVKDKIVSPIIRRSPKALCQITGELFYRYFP